MKDEQEIRRRLREKLPEHTLQQVGAVQLTPGESPPTSIQVGGSLGKLCFACDEPITAEQSSVTTPYSCSCGQVHWIHDSCHAILQAARFPTGRDLIEEQRRRQGGERRQDT